jgi:hypothetical protein
MLAVAQAHAADHFPLLVGKCGHGTTVVLDACGPSEAKDVLVSCYVGATAVLLPLDAADLVGKGREPRSIHIVKVMRVAVSASFGGVAELVRPHSLSPARAG